MKRKKPNLRLLTQPQNGITGMTSPTPTPDQPKDGNVNTIIAVAIIVLFGVLALTIPLLIVLDRQASVPLVVSNYLGLAVIVGLIYGVFKPLQKKVAVIQKQTNGELHHRTAQIEALTQELMATKEAKAKLEKDLENVTIFKTITEQLDVISQQTELPKEGHTDA